MKNVITKYLFPFLALLLMTGIGLAQQVRKSPTGYKQALSDSIIQQVKAIERVRTIERGREISIRKTQDSNGIFLSPKRGWKT